MTATVFCIANQKGGVGKTTTAVNLAAALADLSQKVLLIDLDAQGNATMGSGIEKSKTVNTIYEVMIGRSTLSDATVASETGGYDVVPANRDFAAAEIDLIDFKDRDSRLKDAIESVAENYDFILIDCPPSLSMVTVNALVSAQGVIIPMQCEYFALEGISDLINTIKRIRFNKNPALSVTGLLRVMYDPRQTLQRQVSEQLKDNFGDRVFDTIIPRNVRLAEAPSYGEPGVVYDRASRGAKAYRDFGVELLKRMGRKVRRTSVKSKAKR
jgi:chromosome partitioning protein